MREMNKVKHVFISEVFFDGRIRRANLQFEDENHLVLVLIGVVEVDQLAVVEVVHDVDLLPDQCLLHGVRDRDELGGVDVSRFDLAAPVNNTEGAGTDLLQDVVVVVDAVPGLDVHGLGNVLGVDVKDELVVVLDLALLPADLLAGVGIN